MDNIMKFGSISDTRRGLNTEYKRLKYIFCPLLQDYCKVDCVCFQQPQLIEKTFTVVKGSCRNAMFFGHSMENNNA
jgi:hypothetical protein